MENEKNLLLRSYDDRLTAEEKHRLDDALKVSVELQQEKAALDRLRQEIGNWEPGFAPGFANRVMRHLTGEESLVFQSVFRAVALSGMAAILLVLLTVYFMDGSLNLDSLLGINGYAPDLGMLSMF